MDKNEALIALSEQGRFWNVAFEELSAAERVFRAIWDLESDVNNGGFDQYYRNSSGDTAYHAVEALNEIGARAAAGIVARANAAFPDASPPRDQGMREELVEEIEAGNEDCWDSLDDEFSRYPDDLTELLYEYVRRERAEIKGASDVGI